MAEEYATTKIKPELNIELDDHTGESKLLT
jgi:hypothetical protein